MLIKNIKQLFVLLDVLFLLKLTIKWYYHGIIWLLNKKKPSPECCYIRDHSSQCFFLLHFLFLPTLILRACIHFGTCHQ